MGELAVDSELTLSGLQPTLAHHSLVGGSNALGILVSELRLLDATEMCMITRVEQRVNKTVKPPTQS